MRRLLCATVIAVTATSLSAIGQVATAAPAPLGSAPHESARAKLKCITGVVGFDSERRVTSLTYTNEKLTASIRSEEALPFDVTAWGYYDGSGTDGKSRLQLNTVSTDGKPRNVTIKRTKKALKIGRTTGYQQKSFSPRLFADGGTFYAYAVNGGALKRWTLTRFPDGTRKFVRPVKVAGGFGDATSLQVASISKVRGATSEILYATTESGALRQVAVPIERPDRSRVRTLATSGYEGVTELAWSLCNGDAGYHSLIAIDPVGNRATWTTVKRAATRAKLTQRGELLGVADWGFGAAFR